MNDMTRAEKGTFNSTSDQSSEASAAREAFFRKLAEQLGYGRPIGPWQAG